MICLKTILKRVGTDKMGNSIRDSLGSSDIVADVKQQIVYLMKLKKILVIVEGCSDKCVYSNFVINENIEFYSNAGCGHFKFIVENLYNNYNTEFVIIKDRDFDVDDKNYSQWANIFLTDNHDLETMLLTEEAEEKICHKFISEWKKGIFLEVMKDILNVSYIKWFCSMRSVSIDLKTLKKLGKIYFGDKPIRLQDCINALTGVKGNSQLQQKDVDEFINQNSVSDSDIKQITNGHDFCKALSLKINNFNGKGTKGISEKDIDLCLTMAYTLDHFKDTDLYKKILKWQELNNKSILRG